MDDKNEWGDRHPPGTPAIFEPGDELRCPAARQLSGGAIRTCGQTTRIWAKSRMVMRPRHPLCARVASGTEYHCRSCHQWSDIYPIALDVRLGATG